MPALLISIYGFGGTATSFVLPDFLTRIQGLRALQIGDSLNWIVLPQFVLVPRVALLLKRIDARMLIAFGFVMIAIGYWIDTGLTHDWVGNDFIISELIAAVGLAFDKRAHHLQRLQYNTPTGGGDRYEYPDRAVAGQ